MKVDVVSMTLWETEKLSDVSVQEKEGENKISEYLGHNSSGQFYYVYIPTKVEEFWPTVKKDIVMALNLEK